MSKIFRSLVPLIAAHLTNLIVLSDYGTGGICPRILKIILKNVCASLFAVKQYLSQDLKTLQLQHRQGQIISLIIL